VLLAHYYSSYWPTITAVIGPLLQQLLAHYYCSYWPTITAVIGPLLQQLLAHYHSSYWPTIKAVIGPLLKYFLQVAGLKRNKTYSIRGRTCHWKELLTETQNRCIESQHATGDPQTKQ
jgi:hypothetical protein